MDKNCLQMAYTILTRLIFFTDWNAIEFHYVHIFYAIWSNTMLYYLKNL